jgi:GDP-L-fucose synthase
MSKKIKILIAGQTGMVGSAIKKQLKKKFYIIDYKRNFLDFTNQEKVFKWFKNNKPHVVINAAGKVGGVLDNSLNKDEYLYENLMIGLNLANAAFKFNAKQFINIGSACIYPKKKFRTIHEKHLLTSELEPTNEGYALSKISVLKYCEYIKRKFNKNFITLMPSNLYGLGDNFDLQKSHVIPALVKKCYNAKKKNLKSFEVWGNGKSKRQFLHADDLAKIIEKLILKKTNFFFANVAGKDFVSIKNLSKLIKEIMNYKGKIMYNKSYPNGAPERKLSDQTLRKFGWSPKITLKVGLKKYIENFVSSQIKF